MPLINLYGGLGSGKTLFLTMISYINKHSLNMKLVSNFTLKGIKYEKFSLHTYINAGYSNCIIFLDEGYVYLDSRSSQNSSNKLMSYALFQSRKKNVFLFITVQLLFSLDIRYRSLADYCISCENLYTKFRYTIFNPKDISTYSQVVLPIEEAENFYEFYDTNEIIAISNDSIDFMNEEEKNLKIKEYSKEINEQYQQDYIRNHPNKDIFKIPKIPKYYIDNYLSKRSIDKKFGTLIYNRIRSLSI